MDLDESFTAYAAARWPALYRLAVLLAGESAADDLAQQTLFRAYTSWSKVTDAASPDAYVRRILVNTLISEKRRDQRGRAADAPGQVIQHQQCRIRQHQLDLLERPPAGE